MARLFADVIHSNGENLILGGLGSWQPMGHVGEWSQQSASLDSGINFSSRRFLSQRRARANRLLESLCRRGH